MPLRKKLRILLVEDHETVRQGLKLVIDREPDLEVVGKASDGAQAIDCAASSDLEVVVMDISMPGVSGVVAVVSLTRHADQTFLDELLRAGGSAYVLKQSPHADLLRAIRAAAAGQQYTDRALTPHLAPLFTSAKRTRTGRASPDLSDRGLEHQDHRSHKANAMRKLGLTTRIELLQYARRAMPGALSTHCRFPQPRLSCPCAIKDDAGDTGSK